MDDFENIDDEASIDAPDCPACDGPGIYLGSLGRLAHFTCRNCGGQFECGA